MHFTYKEWNETRLPYCLTYDGSENVDSIDYFIEVNEWVSFVFGDIGEKWGVQCILQNKHDNNSYAFNNISYFSSPRLLYIWKFQNKEDAMLFKLRWGGDI